MYHVEVWDGEKWVRVGQGYRTCGMAQCWRRKTVFGRPTQIVRLAEGLRMVVREFQLPAAAYGGGAYKAGILQGKRNAG